MLKYHIQTIEVGAAGAAGITFTNIPQDYDDLEVVTSVRTTRSLQLDDLKFVFNNDTTNSSGRILYGDATETGSVSFSYIHGGATNANTATANTFGNTKMLILNYSSSLPKSCSADGVSESNETKAGRHIAASLYNSTLPVTSIFITGGSGTLVQYSSASLYGIKRGSDGKTEVASGGAISYSGGYTIHTFQSSGTFAANRDLDVEYLVIGGGGGGGSAAGGGGAGGYRSSVQGELSGGGANAEPKLRVSSGESFGVIVGAGGSGGAYGGEYVGANGSSSIFSSVMSLGGGGGASYTLSGGSGGSGGGIGAEAFGATKGSGTANQGFGGGGNTTGNALNYPGSGGGGAGSAGGSTSNQAIAGNGGTGVFSSITGTSVERAGGGGGSTLVGGTAGTASGGGGAGRANQNIVGISGTANTGGGAGAGSSTDGGTSTRSGGGNGGSGVVIIRYLTPA